MSVQMKTAQLFDLDAERAKRRRDRDPVQVWIGLWAAFWFWGLR